MSEFRILNLHTVTDSRGTLTVMQDDLPFNVARMFWITGADGQTRGQHRHRVTRQGLIAISGEVDVYMNDGYHDANITLSNPSHCLLVEPEDWHTMVFKPGAVLLVLASHKYDFSDYITAPYA